MTSHPTPETPAPARVPPLPLPPLGQRIMDSPFLLLVLGIVVMFVFYTGWGLLEIGKLTPAPLP